MTTPSYCSDKLDNLMELVSSIATKVEALAGALEAAKPKAPPLTAEMGVSTCELSPVPCEGLHSKKHSGPHSSSGKKRLRAMPVMVDGSTSPMADLQAMCMGVQQPQLPSSLESAHGMAAHAVEHEVHRVTGELCDKVPCAKPLSRLFTACGPAAGATCKVALTSPKLSQQDPAACLSLSLPAATGGSKGCPSSSHGSGETFAKAVPLSATDTSIMHILAVPGEGVLTTPDQGQDFTAANGSGGAAGEADLDKSIADEIAARMQRHRSKRTKRMLSMRRNASYMG